MSETYYALTKIDARLREDGTRAQFTLHLAESSPARFYVNPEGLGALIRSLKSAAQSMASKLNSSGQAAKYQAGGFEQAPDRVLSMAVGTEGATGSSSEFMMAVQTEDGVLSRFIIPTNVALRIADEIHKLKRELDPSSSSPSRH